MKPVFVAAGEKTTAPAAPTRPGYTFRYWSASEEGANYTFGNTISDDITLYAVWEANKNTEYKVIYWWENANDDNYSFHEFEIKTGESGSQITSSDVQKSYSGFTYNRDKTIEANSDITIAGDGSTIVNVYYDRNEYQVKFYYSRAEYHWGSRNPEYTWYEYTNLRITAKYGANIASKWPASTSKIWGTNKGNKGQGAAPYQSGISTMPLNGDEFYYVQQNGMYTMNLNYYTEGLDGHYSLDHTDSFRSDNSNWRTTKEDHYDIEGFTYSNNVTDGTYFKNVGRNTYEVNFRYSRNSYYIQFLNGSKNESRIYKYGENLGNVKLETPERPDGVPDSYIFAGWYDNELGAGDPAVLPDTMPAHDITLYAIWKAPTYIATVHTTIKGTGSVKTITINYGGQINENEMPIVKDSTGKVIREGASDREVTVPEGYSWVGWATMEGDSYVIYNFKTQVYNDITLYPYYINTAAYHVTYENGEGGSGTVPTDKKSYAENAYADIQSAAGITPPAGKTFLYWKDSDNNHYYPGDKVQITGNLTLRAVFGDTSPATFITYHSNYPTESGMEDSETKVDGQANNTAITLAKAGFKAPDGYYFVKWKDADDKEYPVGTKIGIDHINDESKNHLYAVWEKKNEITLKANSAVFKYDGSQHTVSGVENNTFTISGSTYTVSGFTTSDPKETDAGEYTNEISGNFAVKDSDGKDVTEQFSIKTINGSLIIGKRSVTLTSETASREYDGTPLTAPTVTVGGDGFVDGEVSNIKATGTITETGSTSNTISYTENSTFKADNYTIEEKPGTLTITKNAAAISVKAEDASKTYDGTALTQSESAVTGLPEGFTAEVTTSGSITDVGSTANTVEKVVIKDSTGKDVTNQFSGIKTVNGTLTVNKRKVTLKSETASKAYDGEPLTKPDVTVGGEGFVEGEVSDVKAIGTITETGSVTNTITYTENAGFKASNYEITKDEGTLTITQSENEVVVTAKNASKMYDGKPLTESGWDVSGLPEGYTAEVTVTGSITDAGIADNIVGNVVIKNAAGKDVTGQFKTIKKNNGKLTVTKRSVTLTSESVSRQYDGTELTAPKVTVGGDGFVEGEVSDIKATGSITNVGSAENQITYTTTDGKFSEKNYTINKIEGTLTVGKRSVTLTSETASKEYDGTPLTAPTVTVGGDGFVDGEVSNIKATGTITETGSTPNTISYTKNSTFKADNYTIEEKPGTLTITTNTAAISVKAEDASKTYDGTALTQSESSVTGLPEGFTAEVTTSGSITDVGSTDNAVEKVVIKDSTGKDVTDQFSGIKMVNGTLTVNKRKVTLKSETASKAYDGEPLTKPDVTVGGEGFVEGEVSDVKATGTITETGSVENTITYTGNEKFKETNYEITKDEGTLTITQSEDEVVVTAKNARKMYDGKPLTESGWDVRGLPEGYTAEVTVTGSITDAGIADNIVGKVVIKNAAGKDVTGQFKTITKNNGKLTVTRRSVTLTSESVSRQYDGTELTAPKVTVGGDGFVEGEVSGIKATGSITNVGSVKNTIVYVPDQNTFKAENYEITTREGILAILPNEAAITVTAKDASKKYDGEELTLAEYDVTGLPEGFTAKVTISGSITNAGTAENKIEKVVICRGDEDVTDQFANVKKVNGTLTINRRSVKLISGSASKEYDGSPLTNSDITVAGDGFAQGEGADFTVTGSQTAVGSSENLFQYKLWGSDVWVVRIIRRVFEPQQAENRKTLAENYDISVQYGTLTVTSADVPDKTDDHDDDDDDEKDHESHEGSSGGVGSVSLYKVDGQTGVYLSGAKFALYRFSGEYVGTYTTDSNGCVNVSYLEYGSYYFTEISAPEGYVKDSTHISFELDREHSASAAYPWNIKFSNTRTAVPTVIIGGTKIWDDNNNEAGARPDSVTMHLMANGVEVGTATATEASGWAYSFGAQAAVDVNGNAITYTVSEDAVKGYTSAVADPVSQDGKIVFNVTNSYQKSVNAAAVNSAAPRTGDESHMARNFAMLAASLAGLIFWIIFKKRRRRAG